MHHRPRHLQGSPPAQSRCPSRYCRLAAVCLFLFLLATAGSADELGPWQLDRTTAPDGVAVYSASLVSTTLVDAGGEGSDYAPTMTIACRARGEPRWSQWLRFDEDLTGGEETDVEVAIDGRPPVEQSWIVGGDRRTLLRDSAADVAALLLGKTVTYSWNWGWSWLWLSDEATFELVELSAVLYVLSKSCNIPRPQRPVEPVLSPTPPNLAPFSVSPPRPRSGGRQ